MDITDRIYRLDRILRQARRPVSHRVLENRLECSRATVTRLIHAMRVYFGAPIVHDRRASGYRYETREDGTAFELPGLWFNASELYALLAAQQLLAEVQPGLLEDHLAPLRERIEKLLEARHLPKGEIARRVRLLRLGARPFEPEHFRSVADAVLRRRRLRITYHGRARNTVTERLISPQRLVHYRDNWYCDAWDHGKRALRTFSLDRIKKVSLLEAAAKDIPEARLDAHLASSYGIFAGPPAHEAVLRFTPERARWVADEYWHPAQKGQLLDDGSYELRIPYSDPRELMLDILKYGPEVEVIAPRALREAVAARLEAALKRYAGAKPARPFAAAQRRAGAVQSRKPPLSAV
jgi:predicted DNA-binding transcriptional regulator YafY